MRLAGLSMLALVGCTSAVSAPPAATYDRLALLSGVASTVVGELDGFVLKAQALEQAATALAAVRAAATPDADATALAQGAWRDAMASWQRLEVLQLGPAGLATDFTGGEGLRDELYSWPVVSPCRIDQETADKSYEAAGYPAHELVNVYGLDALEYLLFRADPGHDCPPQSTATQSWSTLGEAEVFRRRAAYASKISNALSITAVKLRDAWTAEGGFASKLSNAGAAGSGFASSQEAVNQLYAAMFYADGQIKDAKLGDPAGITPRCTKELCPEYLESPWAGVAKENLVANLQMLRRVLMGADDGSTPGFDDALTAAGAASLAAEIDAASRDAIAAVEAIPGSLKDALTASPASVAAAHAAVKKLTDLLKSQFVTVLNLQVPQEGAADND